MGISKFNMGMVPGWKVHGKIRILNGTARQQHFFQFFHGTAHGKKKRQKSRSFEIELYVKCVPLENAFVIKLYNQISILLKSDEMVIQFEIFNIKYAQV